MKEELKRYLAAIRELLPEDTPIDVELSLRQIYDLFKTIRTPPKSETVVITVKEQDARVPALEHQLRKLQGKLRRAQERLHYQSRVSTPTAKPEFMAMRAANAISALLLLCGYGYDKITDLQRKALDTALALEHQGDPLLKKIVTTAVFFMTTDSENLVGCSREDVLRKLARKLPLKIRTNVDPNDPDGMRLNLGKAVAR